MTLASCAMALALATTNSKRKDRQLVSMTLSSFLGNAHARLSCIDLKIMFFHPSIRIGKRAKAELLVERVCVTRNQRPAAQALQVGMRQNALHQPLGEPAPA